MKNKFTSLLALAVVLMFAAPSGAWCRDGNDYLAMPEQQRPLYFMGMLNVLWGLEACDSCSFVQCGDIPDNVTTGQARAIFEKYLQQHPEKRHVYDWNLVCVSLRKAFPYKRDKKK